MPRSESPAVSTAGFQSKGSLEERVLRILETSNPKTVVEVIDAIRREEPLLKEEIKEITDILRRLDERGDIQLIDLTIDRPAKARTHDQHVRTRYTYSWLYLVLLIATATLAAVYLLPRDHILVPVRWALGAVFILLLPGYVTVQALYPKAGMDKTERYAFSLALSLAIISLTAFVLNFSPWGVRLDPAVTTLFLYTVCIALTASYRNYRLTRKI